MASTKWTPADLYFLRTNAGVKTDKEIMEYFVKAGKNFTLKAIRVKRYKEGLIKESGRGICKLKKPKDII